MNENEDNTIEDKINFYISNSNFTLDNTKTEFLRAKGFFNLAKCLKSKGTLEIIVDQPIAVMQNLDAGEIEANAKLGGFIDINTENCQINNNGTKLSTIRIKMTKA